MKVCGGEASVAQAWPVRFPTNTDVRRSRGNFQNTIQLPFVVFISFLKYFLLSSPICVSVVTIFVMNVYLRGLMSRDSVWSGCRTGAAC